MPRRRGPGAGPGVKTDKDEDENGVNMTVRARNCTSTPHTEATVGIREGFSLGHAYRMFPLSFTSPYTGARRRRERERQHDPHPQSILKV